MTNAAILDCYREQPLLFPEPTPINGEKWINVGGLYRLEVQAIVPGNEAIYALMWLVATLKADATLAGYAPGSVWHGTADSGTATPFVTVQFMTGPDTLTINAVRLMTRPLFQVRATGPASISAQIAQAAAQIDVLIGSVRNGSI